MTGGSAHTGQAFAEETREQRVERFSRQLVLREVGAAGQQTWLRSRVCVLGEGIAARAARTWLAAAGVGVGDGGTELAVGDGDTALGSLMVGVEAARATLMGLLGSAAASTGSGAGTTAPADGSLTGARVLVVGAGGLGCPAALGLAAAGAAYVRVVDDDVVERSNLPRQVLHREEDIGRPKVHSLADGLRRWGDLLPSIEVDAQVARFDAGSAPRLLDGMDLVLDASDNFPTKYRVSATARSVGIPAVIGGALRLDGQVFGSAPSGPCYRCVFAHSLEPGAAPTCSSVGILGPVVGLVGLRQVAVAASGFGDLMTLDGRNGDWLSFSVGQRSDCIACGPEADEPWLRG